MTIHIPETAAIMLDAMHAGCTVIIADDRGQPLKNAVIEPYSVAPMKRFGDDEWEPGRIDRERDAYSEDSMYNVDIKAKKRIDIWKGGHSETDASLRDVTMLVRGGLATIAGQGTVRITPVGRAIAQSRIGDGVEIIEHIATPISIAPKTDFVIGEPGFFSEMQTATGEPRLILCSRRGKPALEVFGHGHAASSCMEPAVVRTMAGMMGDAGKVGNETSATFGHICVTLHQGGDVTFSFGSDPATASARISKFQAKIAKAYLVELAKGAQTEASIEPARVEMAIRYLVKPDALSSWSDDVDFDDEEDENQT